MPSEPKKPVSEDISGQLVFLGTGTSHGVPLIGCGCATCTSENPKNSRTRSAVVVGLPKGNLLIDTPPDLRIQLVRERIGLIHAVLYTHNHVDHLFGLDDLRVFPRYLGHPVPVYCEDQVEKSIRQAFDYAFDPAVEHYPSGGIPKLVFHRITTEPFDVLGDRVEPIRLCHGPFDVLGFRFCNVAYCTDVKQIPPESIERLKGLDTLILDCLRYVPHPTHMNVDEALATIELLRPKRAFLTHLCHRFDHEDFSDQLPTGVEVAYDGLKIPIQESER